MDSMIENRFFCERKSICPQAIDFLLNDLKVLSILPLLISQAVEPPHQESVRSQENRCHSTNALHQR